MSTFISRLESLMKEKNVNDKQLTQILNIGRNSITYWRKNGNLPNGDILAKMSEYFGVTIDYLSGIDNVPHADYLIETYIRGINIWSENQFLSLEESANIKEHFVELLLRYKQIVNNYCDLKTNNLETDETINKQVENLARWINLLPEYFARKSTDDSKINK